MNATFERLRSCAFFVALWLLPHAAGLCADDTIAEIAPETIRTWEQAGASAGWLCLSPTGHLIFSASLEDATRRVEQAWEGLPRELSGVKPIPAFQFLDWTKVDPQKLPAPDVPFGLSVATPEKEDGLKAVAAFEHLVALKVDGKVVDRKLPHPLTANHLQGLSKAGGLKALALERCTDRVLPLPENLLAELIPLENLEYLSLRGNPVTNDDLLPVGKLEKLRGLDLQSSHVSNFDALVGLNQFQYLSIGWLWRGRDDGVLPAETEAMTQTVAKLKTLRYLVLESLHINDAHFLEIERLNLERLEVMNGDFSDDGIMRLEKCQKLKVLVLSGYKLTDEGVEKLKAKLPDCRVSAWRPK